MMWRHCLRRLTETTWLILVVGLATDAMAGAAKKPRYYAFRQIMRPYIGGGLETAVIPTPKEADLPDRFVKFEKAAIVCPADYPHAMPVRQLEELLSAETVEVGDWESAGQADLVVLVGDGKRNRLVAEVLESLESEASKAKVSLSLDDAKQATIGHEGYVLYSGWYAAKGVSVVVLAGNSPAGDFWAVQTLRQLLVTQQKPKAQAANRYVRQARIADWPSFEFRGNKRPRLWEYRYKANFGWSFDPQMTKGKWADHFRPHGSWIHHVSRLDATEDCMDLLVNGGTYTDSKGKQRTARGAKTAYERGCRLFTLKYDDTGRAMTEATKAKFGDDYFAAQCHFLRGMHKRIKALNTANRVYFLPQAYWCNAYDFDEYVTKLRAAGGLPDEMALTFCGIEVTSQRITEQSVREYMEAFGLTKTKALIYDNLGRGGDLFAVYGRDSSLRKYLSGIFPERGTPFTRITVYDYLWNPEAYDPERSLKLACRELVGGDPTGYRKLYDFVCYYNANRDLSDYLPQEQAAAKLREIDRTMVFKFFDTAPYLVKSDLAQECSLYNELLGEFSKWGETAGLRRRLDHQESVLRFGYKDAKVKRAARPPKIDGKLDEAAWRSADVLTGFVPLARKSAEPLPEEQQSSFRVLYDDQNLYVAGKLHVTKMPELEKYTRWYPDAVKGKERIYAWRVPCIELFLDPGHTQLEYFQCAINLLAWHYDTHCQSYGDELPGGVRWNSGLRYEVTLETNAAVYEIAFPFKSFGGTPKSGDVWGAQFCRNLEGASTWSYMYDFGGFHGFRQFGHLVFE